MTGVLGRTAKRNYEHVKQYTTMSGLKVCRNTRFTYITVSIVSIVIEMISYRKYDCAAHRDAGQSERYAPITLDNVRTRICVQNHLRFGTN